MIKPFWLPPQAEFIQSKLISEGFLFVNFGDLGIDNDDFLWDDSIQIGDWLIAYLHDAIFDGDDWIFYNDDWAEDDDELLEEVENVFTLMAYYIPTHDVWHKGFIDQGITAEEAAENLEQLFNKWLIEERYSPGQLTLPGLEKFFATA